jgi:hypothetical protein
LLPIGLGLVFLLLFMKANPIMHGWLKGADASFLKAFISTDRWLFWLFMASLCWAYIRPKFRRRKTKTKPIVSGESLTALLFNTRSILISLILFNALFLLQNGMDTLFLWSSGEELPKGMTHAKYAHQGAYPLIITALLAGAFVLIAMQPKSETESNPTIRLLVYAWVAQNIFLVFSSMLRLSRYIEDYSLTYLRVAAFIWMALVALGLALILARIYWQHSNRWLVNRNAAALYCVLYAACFANIGGFIADYNVRHAREVTGRGAALDVGYLQRAAGVNAIPALKWFDENQTRSTKAFATRKILEKRLEKSEKDWRQWTFQTYRLRLILKD